MEVIGSRIRESRISKELTLEQLAQAVGVSAPSILLYEKGKRNPKKKIVRQLAEVLGVTEEYLTGEEDKAIKAKLESNMQEYSVMSNEMPSCVENIIGESGLTLMLEMRKDTYDKSKVFRQYTANIYKGLLDSCVNDTEEEFICKLKKIQDILDN